MATFQGTMSISGSLAALITGNDTAVMQYLNDNYGSVVGILNAAVGDGKKIVRKVQPATTTTATRDLRSITGDGDVAATVFNTIEMLFFLPITEHSTGMGLQIQPLDATTGFEAPWGVFSATGYNYAYGPNFAKKGLPAPLMLLNPAGWACDANNKDITIDPIHASTPISWVEIYIGT